MPLSLSYEKLNMVKTAHCFVGFCDKIYWICCTLLDELFFTFGIFHILLTSVWNISYKSYTSSNFMNSYAWFNYSLKMLFLPGKPSWTLLTYVSLPRLEVRYSSSVILGNPHCYHHCAHSMMWWKLLEFMPLTKL